MKMIDDLPVFDAKKKIKLQITAEDIKTASRKRPNSCAIAKACSRELHAKEVRVHLGRIFIRTNDQNWQRYMTPKSLRSEIIAFDRGGKFVPGTFTISAPPPTKVTTGKRQGGATIAGTKKNKNRKRRDYTVVADVRLGPA